MSITQELQQLDPSLELHNEGDWSNTSLEYSAFNDGGVECEVGEFLYSLIRLIKPYFILETGTHKGIGASYMGMALKHNQKGLLYTYEFLPPLHQEATERIVRMGLREYVNVCLQDVADVKHEPDKFDLILLDTEPQTRFREFVQFYASLKEGGFIFIHDLHRHMHQGIVNSDHPNERSWPYGDIPDTMKQWVKDGKIRPFHFSTPRGLTCFYKMHKGDFVW